MATRVEETAFAKINLDLRICRRRDDGYHDLDSLVVFSAIGDRLTFEPSDKLVLDINGPFASDLPVTDDNLILKAARRLAQSLGRVPTAHITLDKSIPIASGLGGGSADAAATLRGLSRLWNTAFCLADLEPMARELGADVPACLGSRSLRMQGIGEKLTPIDFPGSLSVLLINPMIPVSTPEIFRALNEMTGERRQFWQGNDIGEFHHFLSESINDLQMPAMRLEPLIGKVLMMIEAQPGCALARMSGSGATCFGLFESQDAFEEAAAGIAAAQPDWWVMKTVSR